jgi:predicted permease
MLDCEHSAMTVTNSASQLVGLEQAAQDLRHACRGLRYSRTFAIIALLSLALGIGVNTAVFTLVNGILLKTLPVPDPHRIVEVEIESRRSDTPAVFTAYSYPAVRELRRQTALFDDVIGFAPRRALLDRNGNARPVEIEMVTGRYFSFFNARPALGRLLEEADDQVEGASRVCVLSYSAWQAYFGGDPHILHRVIRIDGVPLQLVGIARSDFVGAELQQRYDVWVPTALSTVLTPVPRETGNYYWLWTLARLQPGISASQAAARLQAADPAQRDVPSAKRGTNIYRVEDASRGFDRFRSSLRDPLLLLLSTVTLVLLVACANLTNLLLARTHERRAEFAVKLALGISRWRLLRQLLMEILLLALGGGVAAVFGSVGLTRFLLVLFNGGNRYQTLDVQLDGRVLLFTLAVCVLTALVAGLYPAWRASHLDASAGLAPASTAGLRRSPVRRALILVQVTVALVLLFGASLFTHSLRNLKTVDLGFDIDRMLSVDIAHNGPAGLSAASSNAAAGNASRLVFSNVLERVRRLPGVDSAALASYFADLRMTDNLRLPGLTIPVVSEFVGPGYFQTMRMPLLRGREFTDADSSSAAAGLIVSQSVAAKAWPDRDPIGRNLPAGAEVVGVVGDRKYAVRGPAEAVIYRPFAQGPALFSGGASLVIRCRGSVAAVERDVRQIVRAAAPDYHISQAASLEQRRDDLISKDRLLAFLSTLFGVLGVTLAVVGLYGLVSYSVARRTREIGIRISVGAQGGDLVWLFLREILVLLAGGMIVGLPMALALARWVESMLYHVSPSDPAGIAATLALMALGGVTATWIPARRALHADPVRALRYE